MRFYPFTPSWVRQAVPIHAVGVYLLAKYEEGSLASGYVGRSDTCLRRRLVYHNLLGRFDYFTFKIATNAEQAFVEEAGWWHLLRNEDFLLNSIHPSVPKYGEMICPYCVTPQQLQGFLDVLDRSGRRTS